MRTARCVGEDRTVYDDRDVAVATGKPAPVNERCAVLPMWHPCRGG